MTAAEIDNLDEILSLLGETAEECIDLDLLLEIGEKAEPLTAVKRPEVPVEKRAKIAVWKYMKKERIFTWKKRSYIRWSLLFNRKLM